MARTRHTEVKIGDRLDLVVEIPNGEKFFATVDVVANYDQALEKLETSGADISVARVLRPTWNEVGS